MSNQSKKKMLFMLKMSQNMKIVTAGPLPLNFVIFKEILYNIYRILAALREFN